MKKITFIGLLFLFIETKELCEARAFETARAQSELFTFQCGQWETIWNSQLIGRYKEMSVWHHVNLTIYPPSLKLPELRVNSSLFNAVNESSLGLSYVIWKDLLWSKAWNGKWAQIFRFRVNLMNPPPFETARVLSELYAFQCIQWEPIWNSQIIGRYKENLKWGQIFRFRVNLMNPPIWNC